MTLTGSGFEKYAKTARRAQFLADMERVVPWGELCALIEPVYPGGEGGKLFQEMGRYLQASPVRWRICSSPAPLVESSRGVVRPKTARAALQSPIGRLETGPEAQIVRSRSALTWSRAFAATALDVP